MYKQARQPSHTYDAVAGSGSSDVGSYWNTLNPVSTLFGLQDKYPDWWASMFPQTDDGQRWAHLTFKTGACGLLAAGVVGVIRGLKHLSSVADLAEADTPATNLSSQISTTFDLPLHEQEITSKAKKKKPGQKKEARQKAVEHVVYADGLSVPNLLSLTLPLGAVILAGSLAYRGVDAAATDRKTGLLDEAVKAKGAKVTQLMQTRARIAKGNIQEDQVQQAIQGVEDDDLYVKHAALQKGAKTLWESLVEKGVAGAGLLAASLFIASAGGAYAYFSAGDENNIKFKAYKKGLKEYAKRKTGMSPVTINPQNSKSYFNAINGDSATVDTAGIRELPMTDPDALNKPISVTL